MVWIIITQSYVANSVKEPVSLGHRLFISAARRSWVQCSVFVYDDKKVPVLRIK